MTSSLLKKLLFSFLLISTINECFGQNLLLSKDAKACVLTCGTGNESYSLFGHTAIRISDSFNNIDVVYNYGAFDFSTPNFVLKFAKGDLQYFAVAHSYTDFINEYIYEKRSVYEQELLIPARFKQKLFDNLNTSLSSGESHYTYKFIDKNCTSMVVNILNKTLGTTAIVKKTDDDKTYRSILYPYFDSHFYEKLGTSIVFGKKVDELGTRIFLPFELMESLKRVKYQNHSLCKERVTIMEYPKEVPFSWWNNCYGYLLLLAFIIGINKKSVTLFYLSIMGVLGVFFVFAGFYSFHQELGYNYNVLLFNPTLLALLYFYFTKNKKGIYAISLLNLFSLTIYLIVLLNKSHLLIVLPLIITNTILLVKILMPTRSNGEGAEKWTL